MQLRVLMVASEVAPFAKTGGLADVLGALPLALTQRGASVAVLLPRYEFIPLNRLQRVYDNFPIVTGLDHIHAQIFAYEDRGVRYFFLDAPRLFGRDNLYGDNNQDYPDNHRRFAVLSLAACEAIRRLFRADILHCHDWQTGLTPLYVRERYRLDPNFLAVRSVFTIHNLAYQGIFGREILPEVGLPQRVYDSGAVEFYGKVSYLKAGIDSADAVTTVSPTYAREIQTQESGWGLDGLLRSRRESLYGILNGADYALWNPEFDAYLAANYTPENVSGKALCKRDLLKSMGLNAEALEGKAVIGIVARLSEQKGFDLIASVADELMREDVVLAVLGSGEARYVELFRELARRYPDRVAFESGYNETLAHKIEAGADMFLMPSQYEPCGLNQIYSLHYGTIPIVRAVGGLADTVNEETGFKFTGYSGREMLVAIREALKAFGNKRNWKRRMLAGMARDYSWGTSAQQYLDLYQRLLT